MGVIDGMHDQATNHCGTRRFMHLRVLKCFGTSTRVEVLEY